MRINRLEKLVVWIVVITFLWSNLVWAGGWECFKLSAPSQISAIVPVADAFITGQQVVKDLVGEGIVSKEIFYKRFQEEIGKGRAGRLANVPCLVFSDQTDPSKLVYYVFNPKEPYFSRITTDPSVNDSLWNFLQTVGIDERGGVGTRKFKIGKELYHQMVYILTDEELGIINTALKFIGISVVSSRLGIKKEIPGGKIWMSGDYTNDLEQMVNWDEITQAVERLKETHPRQWDVLKKRTHNLEYFFFYDNLPSVGGIYDTIELYDDPSECPEDERYVFAVDSDLREILASGKLDKDALVDFYYLLLIHEGTELLLREGRDSCETISPDIETEVVAFIEKAKAYLGLPEDGKERLNGLLKQFDANEPNREDRFMPVVEFIETLQANELETEAGIRKVIGFILESPDYKNKKIGEQAKKHLLKSIISIMRSAEDVISIFLISVPEDRREQILGEIKNLFGDDRLYFRQSAINAYIKLSGEWVTESNRKGEILNDIKSFMAKHLMPNVRECALEIYIRLSEQWVTDNQKMEEVLDEIEDIFWNWDHSNNMTHRQVEAYIRLIEQWVIDNKKRESVLRNLENKWDKIFSTRPVAAEVYARLAVGWITDVKKREEILSKIESNLYNENGKIRQNAVEAYSRLAKQWVTNIQKREEVLKEIKARLYDKDDYVRLFAIEAYSRLAEEWVTDSQKREEVLDIIKDVIEDGAFYVRQSAIGAYGKLAEQWETDIPKTKREWIINKIKSKFVEKECLGSADVRESAIKTYSRLVGKWISDNNGRRKVLEEIQRLIEDSDYHIRRAAIEAYGRLAKQWVINSQEREGILNELRRKFGDTDWGVCEIAVKVYSKLVEKWVLSSQERTDILNGVKAMFFHEYDNIHKSSLVVYGRLLALFGKNWLKEYLGNIAVKIDDVDVVILISILETLTEMGGNRNLKIMDETSDNPSPAYGHGSVFHKEKDGINDKIHGAIDSGYSAIIYGSEKDKRIRDNVDVNRQIFIDFESFVKRQRNGGVVELGGGIKYDLNQLLSFMKDVNILTIKTLDDVPGLFVRSPDDYAVAHFGHFGGENWIYIDEDLFNKLLKEGAIDELYTLILYELVKCYGESQEVAEGIERTLVGDRLRNKVQYFIEESIISSQLAKEVISYYQERENLIEALRRGDAGLYEKAIRECEEVANEIKQRGYPIWQIQAVVRTIKKVKDVPFNKEWIGDELEVTRVLEENFSEEEREGINKWIMEFLTSLGYDEELRNDLFRDISHIVYPLTLINMLPRSIRGYEYFPQVLQELLKQVEIFISVENMGMGGAVVQSPVLEKDVTIQILQASLHLKGSLFHEIVHYLGLKNILPFDGANETITQGITTVNFLLEDKLDELISLIPQELQAARDAYKTLISMGRDRYTNGLDIPRPERVKEIVENLISTRWQDFLQLRQDLYMDTVERLCGIYIAGYAGEKSKSEKVGAHKFIIDYGRRYLPRKRNADIRRRLNYRDWQYINEVLKELVPTGQVTLPDPRLIFREKGINELRKGQDTRWHYGQDEHKMYYFPWDIIEYGDKASVGLTLQEVFRAKYSEEGVIEEEYHENPAFVLLFRVLETIRAVNHGLSEFTGRVEEVNAFYKKKCRILDLELEKERMAEKPKFVQYIEAIFYLLVMTEDVNLPAWDPRIENPLVKSAVEETFKEILNALGEDTPGFYERVRDKIWPIAERLLEEDRQKEMEEQIKKKIINDMIERGEFEVGEAPGGAEGAGVDWDDLSDKAKEKVMEKVRDYQKKMREEERKKLQESADSSLREKIDGLTEEMQDVTGDPSSVMQGKGGRPGSKGEFGSPVLPRIEEDRAEEGIEGLKKYLKELEKMLDEIKKKAEEVSSKAEEVKGQAEGVKEEALDVRDDRTIEKGEGLRESIEGLIGGLKGLRGMTSGFNEKVEEGGEKVEDISSAKEQEKIREELLDKIRKLMDEIEEITRGIAKDAAESDGSANEALGSNEELLEFLKNHPDWIDSIKGRAVNIQKKAEDVEDKLDGIKKGTEKIGEKVDELGGETEKVSDEIGSGGLLPPKRTRPAQLSPRKMEQPGPALSAKDLIKLYLEETQKVDEELKQREERQKRAIRDYTGLADEQREEYKRIREVVRRYERVLRKNIKDVLKQMEQDEWEGRRRKGQLDPRRLHLVKTGERKMMRRRLEPDKVKFRVSLIIDISGSMGDYGSDDKMTNAVRTALLFIEALKGIEGIEFEVVGFGEGYNVYKKYNERLTPKKAYQTIIDLKNKKDVGDGDTQNRNAINAAIDRMRKAGDTDEGKMIIIISDGLSADVQDIYDNNKDIVFIPYGIGNQADAVAKTYAPYGKVVKDIGELAKTIGRAILKQIRKVLPMIVAVLAKMVFDYYVGDSDGNILFAGVFAGTITPVIHPKGGIPFSKEFETVVESKKSYIRLKSNPSLKWPRVSGGEAVPHDDILETPTNVDDIVEIIKHCMAQKYSRRSLLLLGEAGTAKNLKAYYAARLLNQNIRFMPLHSDITEDDLVVRRNFGETQIGRTGWTRSELVEAMEKGEWIIMDEVNKVKPEVLAKLNQILQSRKVYLPDGSVVEAKEGFAVIFTANPPVGPYKVNRLSGEFMNRCNVYEIGYLPANEEKLVLYDVLIKTRGIKDISQVSSEEKNFIDKLVKMANNIRDIYFGRDPVTGSNVEIGELIPRPISTRSLVNIIMHIARRPTDIRRAKSIVKRYYSYDWEEDEVKAGIEAAINNYALIKKDEPIEPDKKGPRIVKDSNGKKWLEYMDIKIPCSDTAPDSVDHVPWDMRIVWTDTNLRYLEDILVDIANGRHMLFIGEAGTGKDLVAEYICYLLYGPKVEVYNVTQNTIVDDLITYMGFGEKGEEKTCLLDGYVVRAMRAGRPIILDEINKAKPEVLACLNNILQFRWVDLPNGVRVRAEPGFFIICTMNPLKSAYIGNKELSGEFLDRFSVHKFIHLTEEEEVKILMDFTMFLVNEAPGRFKLLRKELIEKLVKMTNILRALYDKEELPTPISMRNIKGVMVRLAEYPEDYFKPSVLEKIILGSYHFDEKEHKEEVLNAMKAVKLGELEAIVEFTFNTGDSEIDKRLMQLTEEKDLKKILRLFIEIRNIAEDYYSRNSIDKIKSGLEAGLAYVKNVNKEIKGDIIDLVLEDINQILEGKKESPIELLPVITERVPQKILDIIKGSERYYITGVYSEFQEWVYAAEIEESIKMMELGGKRLLLLKKEITESGFDDELLKLLIEVIFTDYLFANYIVQRYSKIEREDAELLTDIIVNQTIDKVPENQKEGIRQFVRRRGRSIDEILMPELVKLIKELQVLAKKPGPIVKSKIFGLIEKIKEMIVSIDEYRQYMTLILLSNDKDEAIAKLASDLLEEIEKPRDKRKGKSGKGSAISSRLGIKKEKPEGKIWMSGDYTNDLEQMVNWDDIRQAVERLKETHPRQWDVLKKRTHNFEYFFFYDNLPSAGGIYDTIELYGDPSECPSDERYVFAVDSDLREILASGKLDKDTLVDFFYLLMVHEGTELLLREGRDSCETISPDIETEVVAFIEEAKAYLEMPKDRKKRLKGLLRQLDANEPDREDRFIPVVEFIESLVKEKMEEDNEILEVIDFILTNFDYCDLCIDSTQKAELVKLASRSIKRTKSKEIFIFFDDGRKVSLDGRYYIITNGIKNPKRGTMILGEGRNYVLDDILYDSFGHKIISGEGIFGVDRNEVSSITLKFVGRDTFVASGEGLRENMILYVYKILGNKPEFLYRVYGGDCSSRCDSGITRISSDGSVLLGFSITGTYDGGDIGDSYKVLRIDGEIIKEYPVGFIGEIYPLNNRRWLELEADKITLYSAKRNKTVRLLNSIESKIHFQDDFLIITEDLSAGGINLVIYDKNTLDKLKVEKVDLGDDALYVDPAELKVVRIEGAKRISGDSVVTSPLGEYVVINGEDVYECINGKLKKKGQFKKNSFCFRETQAKSIVSSRLGIKKEQPKGKIWMSGDYTNNLEQMVNWDDIRQAVERLKETHPRQWDVLKKRTHNFEYFFFYDNLPSAGGIYDTIELYGDPSECPSDERYVFAVDSDLREILASGKLDKDALVDFYYLLLIHEGTELLLREDRDSCETISPDLETEVVAFIEEAEAYLGMLEERREKFKGLLRRLDENELCRQDRFIPVVEFIETLNKEELETEEGVGEIIDFILTNPDYNIDSIPKKMSEFIKRVLFIIGRLKRPEIVVYRTSGDPSWLEDIEGFQISDNKIIIDLRSGPYPHPYGHYPHQERVYELWCDIEQIIDGNIIVLKNGEVWKIKRTKHEITLVAYFRRINHNQMSSHIGKRVKAGAEYAEFWEAEVEGIGIGEWKACKDAGKRTDIKPEGLNGLYSAVVKRLTDEYGPGILAVVDSIRLVDNIDADKLAKGEGGIVPYAMMVKENGRNILLLDIDAFSDEELLYIVLEHEFKESIMTVVPCTNDAIRELTTNYMSLKLALEKGIRIDKGKIRKLGADLQFFEALEVLQAMIEAGEEITEEKIIAVAIEHMRAMPYYAELFKQFGFAGEWQERIKDAENRYRAAIQVFNDIMNARLGKDETEKQELQKGLKRAVEEVDVNIRVLKTFTGEKRVLGLEGLSRFSQRTIGAMAKVIWGRESLRERLEEYVTRPGINLAKQYWIIMSKERREQLERVVGKDVMEEQIRTLEGMEVDGRKLFRVVGSVGEVTDTDAFSMENPRVIYSYDLEDWDKLDKRGDMLYLPIMYTSGSLYLAAQLVVAGGNVNAIEDKLTLEIFRSLCGAVLGREPTMDDYNMIFRTPWSVNWITEDVNIIRKAIAEIEKAA